MNHHRHRHRQGRTRRRPRVGPRSHAARLAHTDTVAGYDAYAAEVGDDNDDGVITEDESGWSCVDKGNRSAAPATSKVSRRDAMTRVACSSIRGQ